MTFTLSTLSRGVLAAALSLALAGEALAFADDDARRAILDLREQVKQMQADIDVLRRSQLSLSNEINGLKDLNRRLTGRVEELSNSLAQEKRSNRTLYESMDKRLGVFEPQTVTVDGVTVTVDAEEKNAFDAALELLQGGKYAQAERAFRDFTRKWTKSPYRPAALFWWGTSAFGAEHYKTAISSQNQLLRDYPKNRRVADAMLLVASSQAASGSVTAARSTLQKIVRAYPKTDAGREAAKRLKELPPEPAPEPESAKQ